MCRGSGGGDDGLDPSTAPQQQQRGGLEQGVAVAGEEEAVAGAAGPPAGAPESLQERRHGRGRVDLDDPVEVADVDAEFERAGGDDHAVAGLGERLLRATPLVGGERGVRQERGDAAAA